MSREFLLQLLECFSRNNDLLNKERFQLPENARRRGEHRPEDAEDGAFFHRDRSEAVRRLVKLRVRDPCKTAFSAGVIQMRLSLNLHPAVVGRLFNFAAFFFRSRGEPFQGSFRRNLTALHRFDDARTADRVHGTCRIPRLKDAVRRNRMFRLATGNRTAVESENLCIRISFLDKFFESRTRRVRF